VCIWANEVLHITGGKKKQEKRNRQGAQNAIHYTKSCAHESNESFFYE
jgi:hypothetical protein